MYLCVVPHVANGIRAAQKTSAYLLAFDCYVYYGFSACSHFWVVYLSSRFLCILYATIWPVSWSFTDMAPRCGYWNSSLLTLCAPTGSAAPGRASFLLSSTSNVLPQSINILKCVICTPFDLIIRQVCVMHWHQWLLQGVDPEVWAGRRVRFVALRLLPLLGKFLLTCCLNIVRSVFLMWKQVIATFQVIASYHWPTFLWQCL